MQLSETQPHDRSAEFFHQMEALRKSGRPFAIATVIGVRGSASARPGSKALINESGQNVWGWVGGGCAESFVARNAVEAMGVNQTRIVQADLDDEIFGLGMPCGGIMDVFIDPQVPPETIYLEGEADLAPTLLHLAHSFGFHASFERGRSKIEAPPLERAVYTLASAIAQSRRRTFESLRKYEVAVSPWVRGADELLIIGSSRITEELAKIGAMAKWPVRVYGWNLQPNSYPDVAKLEEADPSFSNLQVSPTSAVIVASHHKGDHEFIQRSLEARANYVGLVASQKRSGLVFNHLREVGLTNESLNRIHAPSGLDLDCRNPSEIALSCFAEILRLKAQG